MRSIGLLLGVTGTLLLAWACSGGGDVITPPPENAAPVADFVVPSCTINVACDFASTSTDDAEVTGWSWDFNGDGNPDAATATATFTYAAAGDFNVSLTARDAQGLSDTKTSTITIAPATPPPPGNEPPTAGFTHSCTQLDCTFVSTSTDVAPGTIVSYAWTFGDNGTAAVSNPSHSYNITARADFTVTLTVTDNEGATGVETQTITVDPAPPTTPAPVARFTYSCAAAVCTFVNTSYDHFGTIAASAWTFGDGNTSTELSPIHTYAVTGASEFAVSLTVTDNHGATDIESITIKIDPTAANQPPTAGFRSWCYGESCIFTSTSSDPAPGTIVTYAWDFGDGATEDWNAPFHVYSITARTSFNVTLTVTDNEGATSVATQKVTLTPLPPMAQGCYTSSKTVDCVLDIPQRSTLKLKLLGLSCDLNTKPASRITTPPPVGDQVFLKVCTLQVGQELGIFGGRLDELWIYQAGSQAHIWFSQGVPGSGQPALSPPAGRVTGSWPDWTLNFEDGAHANDPAEAADFSDVVVGVHATAK
jgi:PKD repeat protein